MKEINANGITKVKHAPSEEWQNGLKFYFKDKE